MEPISFVHELCGVFEGCWIRVGSASSRSLGWVEFEDVDSEMGYAGSGGTVVAREGFEVKGYDFDELG